MQPQKLLSFQDFERNGQLQLEVFGGPDFFPTDLTDELITIADAQPSRKQRYNFAYPLTESATVPAAIITAAGWAAGLKCPTNTAILKRYDIHDTYHSAAFELHQDPEEFGTQRLVLVSLSGLAITSARLHDGQIYEFTSTTRSALFIAPPSSTPSRHRLTQTEYAICSF